MLSDIETEGVKKILNPTKYFNKKTSSDIKDGDIIEI